MFAFTLFNNKKNQKETITEKMNRIGAVPVKTDLRTNNNVNDLFRELDNLQMDLFKRNQEVVRL